MALSKRLLQAAPLLVLIALAYLLVPRLCTDYYLLVLNYALVSAILVYGLSILLGMGGQLSFASITFMGVGGYLIANLCSDRFGINMNPLFALLIVVAVLFLLGLLLGLVLFRLKGTFFTFATIALVQMSYTLYNNYKPLFGGTEGIAGVNNFQLGGLIFDTNLKMFYLCLTLVILLGLLVERIRRTKLGRSLASIRDNDVAALTLGVNVYRTKVIAFTLASVLAGLSGAMYTFVGKYAVSDYYTWSKAANYVIMGMLGGINSTVGVVFGSVIVKLLPEVFRQFKSYVQLFWGVAIILLMVFMPEGCAGLVKTVRKRLVSAHKNRKQEGADHGTDS